MSFHFKVVPTRFVGETTHCNTTVATLKLALCLYSLLSPPDWPKHRFVLVRQRWCPQLSSRCRCGPTGRVTLIKNVRILPTVPAQQALLAKPTRFALYLGFCEFRFIIFRRHRGCGWPKPLGQTRLPCFSPRRWAGAGPRARAVCPRSRHTHTLLVQWAAARLKPVVLSTFSGSTLLCRSTVHVWLYHIFNILDWHYFPL